MLETVELRILSGLMNGNTLAEIGEELSLSHPSVSKILRAAERKADVKLVERRGRRLQLTSDGARIALAAGGTLATLQEIDTLIAGIRTGQTGTIRIIARNAMCNYLLAPVLRGLLADAQQLDIDIQGTDSDTEIWTRFEDGEFEIAIDRLAPPPHIRAAHLFDDPLCLCVAKSSPLSQEPLDWMSLSNQALVGPFGSEQLWGQFPLVGIRPRSRLRTSNVALALGLVESGDAVALMYRSVALAAAAAGRVSIHALPETQLAVSYWMATRHSAGMSPLVNRFAELLREHLRAVATPQLVEARALRETRQTGRSSTKSQRTLTNIGERFVRPVADL